MKIITKTFATSLIILLLAGCAQTPSNPPEPMQTDAPKAGDMIAIFDTDKGKISVKLFPKLVPETVKNFTELAKAGKYNGVKFHRVINDFMIQSGDFELGNGRGGYSYKGPKTIIPDEFTPSLKNIRGALSMANRGPDTGASQFFIVQGKAGADYLNNKHAVFGQVYEGMDVVDAIAAVEKDQYDAPTKPVIIKTITISTL